MKKIISILFIFALLYSCKEPNPKETPFENKYDQYINIPIVKKTIKGKRVLFILDSGANISIVDSAWYKKNSDLFGYSETISMRVTGISGAIQIKSNIVHAEIDDTDVVFTTSNISPVINNLRRHGYSIIGILGSDYLSDNNLVIDYRNKAVYQH